MFKALELPREQDISQFTRLLWQHKISHRVHRIEQWQVLAVPREEEVGRVQSLYKQWVRGDLAPGEDDASDLAGYFDPRESGTRLLHGFIRAPVTILVILACLVLAGVSQLGSDRAMVELFLYPDFTVVNNIINLSQVVDSFTLGRFLSMIAPIFMHVGFVHVAFNMLWFWEFGKRIEAAQASWTLVLLIVVLALVSNTVQYIYGGGNNFVGMSGVVYGMLSYIWMWQLFDPRKGLGLPPALIFIMLVLLVIITMLGIDFIANGGHIGGLLAGVLYGAATATASRIHRAYADKQHGRYPE